MCKCDVSLWGNLIDFALTKNVKKRAVHTFSIAQIGQNKRARTAQIEMVDVCARHRPQSRSRELFEATGNGPNAVQGERITGISSYNQTPDAPRFALCSVCAAQPESTHNGPTQCSHPKDGPQFTFGSTPPCSPSCPASRSCGSSRRGRPAPVSGNE